METINIVIYKKFWNHKRMILEIDNILVFADEFTFMGVYLRTNRRGEPTAMISMNKYNFTVEYKD